MGTKISEAYFICGCIFLIMPYVIVSICNFWCCSNSKLFLGVAKAPLSAIFITGRYLLLHEDFDDDDEYEVFGMEMNATKLLKIFENIFEALPQLTLSCVYIANNGGIECNVLNVVSSIFSSGSIIMGIIASIIAFKLKWDSGNS